MFRAGVFLTAVLAMAQAPPLERPDARTLIAESAVAIRKYQSYRLDSVVTIDMHGGQMDSHLDIPSSVVVRRPDRMRIQSKSKDGTITIVSDGEHTWFYLSAVKKYVKRDAVGLPDAAIGNQGLVPKNLPDIQQSVKSMKITGEDAVDVAGKQIGCWIVETSYGEILLPEQHLAIRNAVQRNWIAKADKLSLQTDFSGEVHMAGIEGPVVLQQSTRTTALRLNIRVPDSEFVFTPPANAKATADWTLPGIVKPDVEGKPAPEIDGVDWKALRGKVVLLNIEESWCAPCRRESAVIEKLKAEFPDVEVVGVQAGQAGAALLADLSITSLPTIILVDREGKIVSYDAGARGEKELRERLEKIRE